MTPCAGPSLSSTPVKAQATTCGCASQPAEQPVFANAPSPEREYAPHAVSHGMSFDPVHVHHASYEGPISLLLPAWLVVAALISVSRRRPYILRLGLAGQPAAPRVRTPWPRLVLCDRERRVLQAIGSAFRGLFVPAPRGAFACAVGYSQRRLRNQTSMPPPMAMHTPQKIG